MRLLPTTLYLFISSSLSAPLYRRATSSALSSTLISSFAPSCTSSPSNQCRTPTQVASIMNKIFDDYNVQTVGEKAAILSLMSFESGNFEFNKNQNPSNHGQGTRNMMTFPFVLLYAKNISSISSNPILTSSPSDDTKDAILDLVRNSGDYNDFASATWFLYNQCDASVQSGIKSGSEEGWTNYVQNCVGVGSETIGQRKVVWQAATKALNSQPSSVGAGMSKPPPKQCKKKTKRANNKKRRSPPFTSL